MGRIGDWEPTEDERAVFLRAGTEAARYVFDRWYVFQGEGVREAVAQALGDATLVALVDCFVRELLSDWENGGPAFREPPSWWGEVETGMVPVSSTPHGDTEHATVLRRAGSAAEHPLGRVGPP